MRFLVVAVLFSASLTLLAQQSGQPLTIEHGKPLPDLVPMMQKVILKERASEVLQRNYLVHENLDSWEGLGKCWPSAKYPRSEYPQCMAGGWTSVSGETRESEAFWLQDVRVSRLLRVSRTKHHDQIYSHTLSPDELRQENARIDAELTQVAKARAAGDSEGERKAAGIPNELRVSRLLELGTFSNPRRSEFMGRSMIVVDYKGGACVGACTPLDNAARSITGILSIDEEDLAVTEFKGIFTETWIEPGNSGLKVLTGSQLTYWAYRREGGIWFPGYMLIDTKVTRGLTSHTSSTSLSIKDYRKFRATSTILPDFALVPEGAVPESPPIMPSPR